MNEKQYRYSEIFANTIQGEGKYTGIPTAWIRFWGCNLECKGYGQKNLADPSTWELPYEDFDPLKVKVLEDLPVWHRGCDSSYSWSLKYRHLAHLDTAKVIVDKIENLLKNNLNTNGKFRHPHSGCYTHMAFTGGEPMMSQHAIVPIMEEFESRINMPKYITVETNGTQGIRKGLIETIASHKNYFQGDCEWFWSVSPKIYSSGEDFSQTILPDVLAEYAEHSNNGQLKFVVDGSDQTWEELEEAVKMYRQEGITWDVWVMPVGADLEMQNEIAPVVARQAIERGYKVATRSHVYLFGNTIGV